MNYVKHTLWHIKDKIKKYAFVCAAFLLVLSQIVSCTEDHQGQGEEESAIIYYPGLLVDPYNPEISKAITDHYKATCWECQWYFCPPLDSVWQKQICHDTCQDPPVLVYESECEEYLQCDPTQYHIEYVECVTEEGFPGQQEKVCNKGQIQYTDCITDCEEEACNHEDDDCDGQIDEGQLNACNDCGILPPETCNNIDDNCDGVTDEDLIQPCSTACGSGYEMCDSGNWISCTAPPVNEEICDGLDNDCDGSIDEGLECVCTIQDVGVLFPCQEDPLLCGQGYKTCECTDPSCTEFAMTECYALCNWMPPTDPSDVCDPLVGMIIEQEKCNNFDENCNQLIDEDLFSACYTGPEGTLLVGICEPGMMTCDTGTWGSYDDDENFIPYYCKDEVTPQVEVCNGIDDDCDGITDWGEEMKETDVLFIVDWSGSMGDEMDAVMIALNQFAQNFSDEEVIKWAFMRGPVSVSSFSSKERLELQQDLVGFSDYLASLASMDSSMASMNTSYEMILDAIYLAVHNITSMLNMIIPDLEWTGPAGVYPWDVDESVPPLQNFKVSWRPAADRIIIVFTDEHPQSYLEPELLLEDVKQAVLGTPQLKLYTFSRVSHKIPWEELANAGNGEWYQLTNNPTQMYASLMEILDDICQGGN